MACWWLTLRCRVCVSTMAGFSYRWLRRDGFKWRCYCSPAIQLQMLMVWVSLLVTGYDCCLHSVHIQTSSCSSCHVSITTRTSNKRCIIVCCTVSVFLGTTTTTTILRPFFSDHPGEPVPEENFWTLWCKERLTLDFMVQGEINRGRHTDHPAGRHSMWTNQCPPPPHTPYFLRAEYPFCRPTNSVKTLKATSAFGLGRRR